MSYHDCLFYCHLASHLDLSEFQLSLFEFPLDYQRRGKPKVITRLKLKASDRAEKGSNNRKDNKALR